MVSTALKQHIFRWGGRGLRSAMLSWMVEGVFRRQANIIFYHAVWPAGDKRAALFGGMNLDQFASDLKILARRFQFVSLETLLQNKEPDNADKPYLVLTFDDGFDLTAGGATDVMDELGIQATVFVNTALVNYQQLMWQHRFSAIRHKCGDDIFVKQFNQLQEKWGNPDRLNQAYAQIYVTHNWSMDKKDEYVDELWQSCHMPPMDEMLNEERPYFDWDGLQQWLERGHGVGLHTHTHPFCSLLDDVLIQSELINPAIEVKERLGLTELSFAYPFGERLRPEHEQAIIDQDIFTCLLGTSDVFSPLKTDPNALVRVEAEAGIDQEVFGKAVIRATKRKLISK